MTNDRESQIDIPPELIEQIRCGNAVLFVGAGLSQGAGLPGWPELLRQMMAWAETHGIDMHDRAELEGYVTDNKLLLVAEEMRDRLGQENFHRFMTKVFLKPDLKPTDAHKILPQIPFAAALTSNYDTLLEMAYTLVNGTKPHSFTQADYPELSAALRSNKFYILHVHGTIDCIKTVVLGRKDYRQVIHANPAYRQYLTNLFGSKTVLFVGFGLNDPDLLSLLDELQAIFRDYAGQHFALMNAQETLAVEQKRFEKDYGIHIIPYIPSAPDHPEVHAFLADLAAQMAESRKAVFAGEPGSPSGLAALVAACNKANQAIVKEENERIWCDTKDESKSQEEIERRSERLYVNRKQVESWFSDFVLGRPPIFLLIGEAGTGKTTLLLHLLKTYANLDKPSVKQPVPCLFLIGREIVGREVSHLLMKLVYQRLTNQGELPLSSNGNVFREIHQRYLQEHDTPLLLFVDAINESPDPDLKRHLNELAEDIQGTNCKVCLSCRSDVTWGDIRDGDWMHSVYASRLGQPSAYLREFSTHPDDNEFELARQAYFDEYDIHGTMSDEAREICRVPLMMKFFANAYRGKHLGDYTVHRAKEIFDAYADRALLQVAERSAIEPSRSLKHQLEKAKDELRKDFKDCADLLIRGSLFEIVDLMRRDRKNLLLRERAEEAIRSRVSTLLSEADPNLPSLILDGILSERIVLEQEEKPSGEKVIRFPFDKYLEYTLARQIAHSWHEDSLDSAAIREAFKSLMKEHQEATALIVESGSIQTVEEATAQSTSVFNYLYGALWFLVQIVEEDKRHPGLYLDLLKLLATGRYQPKEGIPAGQFFIWKQLACDVIPSLQIAREIDELNNEGQFKHPDDRKRLLEIIELMGEQSDFVLRWELERTLTNLLRSGRATQFVSEVLDNWSADPKFTKRLFAAEILGDLKQEADWTELTNSLSYLGAEADFWIKRAVAYACLKLARGIRNSDNSKIQHLVNIVKRMLRQTDNQLVRGRLLSVLISLEREQDGTWSFLENLDWNSEPRWVRRSVAETLGEHANYESLTARRRGLQTLMNIANAKDCSAYTRYAVAESLAKWAAADPQGICNLWQSMWQQSLERGNTVREQWVRYGIREALARSAPSANWNLPVPDPATGLGKRRIGWLTHPRYLAAEFYNHPECGERLEAIIDVLEQHEDKYELVALRADSQAKEDDLLLVHDGYYIQQVKTASESLKRKPLGEKQVVYLEEYDFQIRPESYDLACWAAGGVMQAASDVAEGKYDMIFALVRPPGHLATNRICIFNNVAIAVRHLQQRYAQAWSPDGNPDYRPRILIFDCDNHHGYNTYHTFRDDNSVLYFSIQQRLVHPGTGLPHDIGQGDGMGYSFGVPIPENSDDKTYKFVLDHLFWPIAQRFCPDFIFLSAGFDSHRDDHFTDMQLTEESYRYLGHMLASIAQRAGKAGAGKGRVGIVAALEGGYALEALGDCVKHMLDGFAEGLDKPLSDVQRPSLDEVDSDVVKAIRTVINEMDKLASQRAYPLYSRDDYDSELYPHKIQLLTHDLKVHSELELVGDVKTILYSRCDKASLRCLSHVPFGLGGGATGPDNDWALQHLGEFITIGGIPIWMPSGLEEHAPRIEGRDSSIFTPFFIRWDGGIHASFYFESNLGASILQIYRLLFDEMEKLREGLYSPTLAVVMLAEAKTKEIVDKAMILSPTRQNAPANSKPIIDKINIDTYFRWNLARENQSPDQSQLLIVVGVGLDMQHPDSVGLDKLLKRAFYVTPGITTSAVQMLHNHAVAMGEITIPFNELVEKCASGKINPSTAVSDLLEKHSPDNILRMIHIENDTLIRRALVGVGIIDNVSG